MFLLWNAEHQTLVILRLQSALKLFLVLLVIVHPVGFCWYSWKHTFMTASSRMFMSLTAEHLSTPFWCFEGPESSSRPPARSPLCSRQTETASAPHERKRRRPQWKLLLSISKSSALSRYICRLSTDAYLLHRRGGRRVEVQWQIVEVWASRPGLNGSFKAERLPWFLSEVEIDEDSAWASLLEGSEINIILKHMHPWAKINIIHSKLLIK